MPRILSRVVAALILMALVGVVSHVARNSHVAASPEQAKHGLTGSYYIGAGQWDKDTPPTATFSVVQIWSDPNDFNLPRAFTAPAATRVDGQIAFGQGKGFQAKGGAAPTMWWPTGFPAPAGWRPVAPTDKPWDNLATVIWKGYIHLPRAGTYYFATISNGPSALYLNQARVALNGVFGGALVSDAFSYAKEDVQEFVQNLFSGRGDAAFASRPGNTYVIPVSIDAPRDLPIEIRYNPTQHFSHLASEPFGIDLFWVTPDSPRDANGKPIAKIVPSEVLYTEPPSTIEKPTVRSANSTIEADHLYFPTEYAGESVTVTIRLADKDGNPMAGKRVYVSSLASYGNSDAIAQPDKPTDKNGETTAKIRANATYAVGHDSAIFATDITDLVDVAQVAHVTFQQVDWNFFTDAFSPYYDRRFSVTPRPPVVGQPATLKTELKNHSKFPATVTVTFLTTDWNIGFTNFEEIAKVKDITLQPGESKEVSTTFTPKEVMSHKCYRVEVEGRYIAMNPSDRKVFAAALLPLMMPQEKAPAKPSAGLRPSPPKGRVQQPPPGCVGSRAYEGICDSQQINTETVFSAFRPGKSGWLDIEERTKDVTDFMTGVAETVGASIGVYEAGKNLGEAGAVAAGPLIKLGGNPIVQQGVRVVVIAVPIVYGEMAVIRGIAHEMALDPPDPSFQDVYLPHQYQLPPPIGLKNAPEQYAVALDTEIRSQLEIISLSTAALVSLERYQAAKAAHDQRAENKQLTAYINYTSETAQAFERGAHIIENLVTIRRALGMPQIVLTPDQIHAAQQRLAAKGFEDDSLAVFSWLGVSQEFLNKEILPAAKGADPNRAAGSFDDKLLELAAAYRLFATQLKRKSSANYVVENPHDKAENVDLLIRPISIPPDWKLSVVNAEQAMGQLPPGDPPEMPVREVEAGKRYAVTLPAKAQIRVASVLVPAGEVGEHTRVKWAVEGRIGNELIGGMVHEMTVPYVIPDLEPTLVGADLPNSRRIAAEIAVAIILLGLLVYFFLFWRRRRHTGTSSPV